MESQNIDGTKYRMQNIEVAKYRRDKISNAKYRRGKISNAKYRKDEISNAKYRRGKISNSKYWRNGLSYRCENCPAYLLAGFKSRIKISKTWFRRCVREGPSFAVKVAGPMSVHVISDYVLIVKTNWRLRPVRPWLRTGQWTRRGSEDFALVTFVDARKLNWQPQRRAGHYTCVIKRPTPSLRKFCRRSGRLPAEISSLCLSTILNYLHKYNFVLSYKNIKMIDDSKG